LTDGQRKQILQNAIINLRDLRQEHSYASHASTIRFPELTYSQYFQLLLLAADTHDNELKSCKGSFNNSERQQVYFNELSIHDDNISSNYVQEGEGNHIDTYLTNVSERKPPVQTQKARVHSSVTSNDCSWIPNDIWSKIPEVARKYLTTPKSASSINNTTVCSTIETADGQDNGAYVNAHQAVEDNTDSNKSIDKDNKLIDYRVIVLKF
jgi:hypothetical protein